MPPFPGFLGPSYVARSPYAGLEEAMNLYPEPQASDKTWTLYSVPGLKRTADLPGGVIRGLYTASVERTYAVSGDTLYELTRVDRAVARGTLQTLVGPVSFTDNGTHLVLADGVTGYTYAMNGGTLTPITQDGFGVPTHVGYVDGYVLANRRGTAQFAWSALGDATAWPALNYATAEGRPDALTALVVQQREIWLIGSQSTEVWFSTGDSTAPFARIQGAFVEYGSAAPWSIQSLSGHLLWVTRPARDAGQVVMVQGYQPQRISTFAVEERLRRLPTLDAVQAWTYAQAGHQFYVLVIPADPEETWCFDLTTGLWHTRGRLVPTTGAVEGMEVGTACAAFSVPLVGSRVDGRVYVLDLAYARDDTLPLVRQRTAPHLVGAERARVTYHGLELTMQVGDGLAGGQPAQVMLRWSDDEGHTWTPGRWQSAGALGAYRQRVRWQRLGQSRSRVYSVKITDPIPVALTGAVLDVSQDRH